MTAVVVVALVVAAVVGVVIGFNLRNSGSPAGSSIAEKDQYLQTARNALVDARRLALDLERSMEPPNSTPTTCDR